MITIRKATLNDAKALLAIYAPYITETAVTFEYEVCSVTEFAQRIRNVLEKYPYFVCEVDHEIVAYGYAHAFKERVAYQWSAELSVYVSLEHSGHGYGKIIYQALIDCLKLQNVKTVYGVILATNQSSIRLHQHFDFRFAGEWKQTGYKLNQWHDVKVYEKAIGVYDGQPQTIIPFPAIEADDLKQVYIDAMRWYRP